MPVLATAPETTGRDDQARRIFKDSSLMNPMNG